MIRASQKDDKDARYYNVDFNRTDSAKIAEGFGVKSYTVSDPEKLEEVMAEAFAHDGPPLIDIISQPLEQAAAPVLRWMG